MKPLFYIFIFANYNGYCCFRLFFLRFTNVRILIIQICSLISVLKFIYQCNAKISLASFPVAKWIEANFYSAFQWIQVNSNAAAQWLLSKGGPMLLDFLKNLLAVSQRYATQVALIY